MLKLRLIGIRDYSVLVDGQRIGRIRALPASASQAVWLWNVVVHLTGRLPISSSKDLDTAKADFKTAWEELKARTTPEDLAAACRDMNVRDDRYSPRIRSPGRRAPDAAHFCADHLAGLSSGSLSYRRRLRVPNDQGFVRFATWPL